MLKWQKGVLSYYYKVSFFRLALWFDFYRPGQTQSPFWILDPNWHVNIWWNHVTSHSLTLLMEEFLVRMMSCNSPNLFNSCKFPTNLRHIWRTLLWDRVKDWIENKIINSEIEVKVTPPFGLGISGFCKVTFFFKIFSISLDTPPPPSFKNDATCLLKSILSL